MTAIAHAFSFPAKGARYRQYGMARINEKTLPDGLYESLLTESLVRALSQKGGNFQRQEVPLSVDESAGRLADAIASQLRLILDDMAGEGSEKLRRQLDLVNSVLVSLRHRLATASDAALNHEDLAGSALHGGKHQAGSARIVGGGPAAGVDADARVDLPLNPPSVLYALHRGAVAPERPETGLTLPWLFTAGKGSPSLLTELRRELAACDQVDILVSFITHAGVRKLQDILQAITAVGADGEPATRLRILTTTYTGATELQAVDALARLPGAEVRISLDGQRTRLHAKAWLFHRLTGFGSAYVGSANLSGAALMGGLEWTVKFTERGQGELFERARAHFETLWEDREFQPYDVDDPAHRRALSAALQRESGQMIPVQTTFFDLRPKSYQQNMLDQLKIEREHGRCRNLLVAATGTGKTVVAAFDYRRQCDQQGGRPRLLFVAHREEILRQALRTFREVMRDNSFGELLLGGVEPERFDHLFATIDSVSSRGLLASLGADYWHVVIVDECHRLAADRFDRFVTTVRPKILLGLTATPERSDGQSILRYFDNRPDGSCAVELRLWHALDLQLLCPFEYYACDDETDFSSVDWGRPGEIASIDKLVTGNDMRARLVIREWQRLAGDVKRSKALLFCVSVAHAQFMTDTLNAAGIRAICVVGSTSAEIRRQAPIQLEHGEISAIVTCDLYNEGVDIPCVDTLLLLRPTQSPVVFQQQIGRGLRLAEGKDSCLVLDFVGRHQQSFRFDRLLSPITGLSRRELIESVDKGFGRLPAGCHIHLQRRTREQILDGLRRLIQQNWRRLTTELQAFATLRGSARIRLADFLREQGVELTDVYRSSGHSGWTQLKRSAGMLDAEQGDEDEYFGRRYTDLLHLDDPERIDLMLKVAEPGTDYRVVVQGLDQREQRLLQMLAYQVDGSHYQRGSGEAFLARLSASPLLRDEMFELAGVLHSRLCLPGKPIPGLEDVPLCLHGRYGIREILTAVRWLSAERRSPFQAGVLPLAERQTELLFVTLDKREGYHERIAYHDYAISPERFHWQSQNAAGRDTKSGRRYLESPGNGWQFQLFVRLGKGEPYHACGPVSLIKAHGSKPMSILWKLSVPLPIALFQAFSVLRDA